MLLLLLPDALPVHGLTLLFSVKRKLNHKREKVITN